MYQSGGTVKSLIDGIRRQKYILPAIQREFVWKPEQVCRLFDSLMQGYPFGTFLFWKIEPENLKLYKFYEFIKNYHQRDNYHCKELISLPERECVAVLDGQQRMTSLNIGLLGSYTWKAAGKRWSNDDAFTKKDLYLNLLGKPDGETGTVYRFEFISLEKSLSKDDTVHWFKVSRILDEDIDDLEEELDDIEEKSLRKKARSTLKLLYRTIHDRNTVSYYEESEQSLERVLNIFIRMNSGGTALSYSDLLLSVAVAQWSKLNAREEIHNLVDEMNSIGDGFDFSKDLVLKAGLMLSDIGSVGFKVDNFNKSNMAVLESNWRGIRDSLILAAKLLASFGFNSQNIKAESSVLPIAYYLYNSGHNEKFLSKSEFNNDRTSLRCWLIRSLLKPSGIWGSGLDALLTDLRKVIKDSDGVSFPLESIEKAMASRGKSLSFDEDELEQLLELKYGDKRTFALLSLVFTGFNFSLHFHVDHVYPKSRFTESKLRKLGVPDSHIKKMIDGCNRLPNLQLLEGTINNEKREKLPHDWYEAIYPDIDQRKLHLSLQAIEELPKTILEFQVFYERRKKMLEVKIRQVLKMKEKQVAEEEVISWPEYEEIECLQLNAALLSEEERRLVLRVSKDLGIKSVDDFNVANFIYDWVPKSSNAKILGSSVLDVAENLRGKIRKELDDLEGLDDEEIENSLVTATLLRVDRVFDLNPQQVDNILSADLDLFLEASDERNIEIIRCRFGIDGRDQKTLEELGKDFGVTRERIRQLEVKAIKYIKRSLSLTSAVIRANVEENLGHKFSSMYPVLSSRFGNEDGLFQFVESISEANKGEFKEIISPDINVSVVEDWFYINRAPMPIEVAIEILKEQFGCGTQKSRNALYQAMGQGRLCIKNEGVTPTSLKKVAAAAQAALQFPDGVGFREIHKLANLQGYCKTDFPLDRQEHGIQGAVDEGYLYLCGHGEYKHTKYLSITEDDMYLIESEVKTRLQSAKSDSIDSLHLKMGVYEKSDALKNFDYFDVRHVVRAYGERYGIFFAGKSGTDTVSFDEDVTPKGQQDFILEWFRSESKPKTRDDIAKVIRSGSVNHASFYINELIDQGTLVRVDYTHYATPEYAFKDAPLETVFSIAKNVVGQALRPVEIGIIVEKCNAKLHLSKTKAWYMSLIKIYCKKHSVEWYFYHNLVSMVPINNTSIQTVVRDFMGAVDSDDELFKAVYKRIKASRNTIKNAINNVRSQDLSCTEPTVNAQS